MKEYKTEDLTDDEITLVPESVWSELIELKLKTADGRRKLVQITADYLQERITLNTMLTNRDKAVLQRIHQILEGLLPHLDHSCDS